MSTPVEQFQVPLEIAETYEAKFVPALFAEWAPHLVDAAGVAPGQSVLDVACGTGVVARAAADRMKGQGRVVGLDLNEAMLSVARRLRPDIEWQQGDAGNLPFAEDTFDVVLCQSALMFFPDPARALREMARVVRPGGTVGVQVWSRLEAQPGYGPFIEMAARHAGPEAVQLLGSYWALGDLDALQELTESAGLHVSASHTRLGAVKLGSIDEFVTTEVESTPLIERISDETYRRIREDAQEVLAQYRTQDGRAEIPIAGHLLTARRR